MTKPEQEAYLSKRLEEIAAERVTRATHPEFELNQQRRDQKVQIMEWRLKASDPDKRREREIKAAEKAADLEWLSRHRG